MEKITTHKLASLCQRMPVDTYLVIHLGETMIECRVVKSDLAQVLRSLDGRATVECELRLDGLYIYG